MYNVPEMETQVFQMYRTISVKLQLQVAYIHVAVRQETELYQVIQGDTSISDVQNIVQSVQH